MSLTTNIDNIYKKGVVGNVRKAQEDSHDIFLKTPNGDAFVVCDGMGGHVGGAVASSTAVKSIKEQLEKEKYPSPIEALNHALSFANDQILGYASEHSELKGMGTTACVVLFQDDEAWIAHVGDSRIYLFLGDEKQLHRVTKDHSFVQTLVDAGEITDEEAEHHPNKNRILKALGIVPDVKPTFNYEGKPILPKNGDIFMICSDGLSGMIPDSTIERVLSEKDLSLAQKGDKLIELAMVGETVQPGGQDNCTLELIQIDNSPWKESEFKSYNPVRTLPPSPKEQAIAESSVGAQSNKSSRPFVMSFKLIAALIVVLLVLGVGGWYFYHQSEAKKRDVVLAIERLDAAIQITEKTRDSIQRAMNRIDDGIAKWKNKLEEAEKVNSAEGQEIANKTLKTYQDSLETCQILLEKLNVSLDSLYEQNKKPRNEK